MASNAIITTTARQKLVSARAGASELPAIVGMAFGDGGVNGSGVPIPPTETQTALTHELLRKPIDGYTFPDETTCRYQCTLLESEAVGENINEIALYDADGDLVCIKTLRNKGKDEGLKLVFTLDDIM